VTGTPPLYCPIRGFVNAGSRAADTLTYSEERRRIDCIQLLLAKGYPKEWIAAETVLLRFGHSARSSLRADIVVYDRPVVHAQAEGDPVRRRHFIRIVAEIKRDHASADSAKQHPLRPALASIPRTDTIGIYWDDVERSVLHTRVQGPHIHLVESSIATLPAFDPLAPTPGPRSGPRDIEYADLEPAENLVTQFAALDDILHQAGHDKEERYTILAKVLLMKIWDEEYTFHNNRRQMWLQDFSSADYRDPEVEKRLREMLGAAMDSYSPVLPERTSRKLDCSVATLRRISRVICRLNILESSEQVIQDFFMYFGRFLFKVDLGQYFTPYEVTRLMAEVLNPRYGDRVVDPACGTGDFLIAAADTCLQRYGTDLSGFLEGIDTAKAAVGLSKLNLLLHGRLLNNILNEDSLLELSRREARYCVALCNPPFGTRIVEKRRHVLERLELGRQPHTCAGEVLPSQETGLLFVEACLRLVKPGGRVGIILPNGYLGNRSARYAQFRSWLLRQARVVAVIGFPRFTFKRSGADVSASAVFFERRLEPLEDLASLPDDPIHFNLIEKVGWDLQTNRSQRIYRRDPTNGERVRDATGQFVLDSDLPRVLAELYSSAATDACPWLAEGRSAAGKHRPHAAHAPATTARGGTEPHSVPTSAILERSDLCLDPKRWCVKHAQVISAVRQVSHFALGDVIRPVVRKLRKQAGALYRYVEIEKIYETFGAYVADEYFGWALPGRARLVAAPGDLFIANIWSSAGKWMIAGDEARDGYLIVTNGCTQFEVIPGRDDWRPDLVFGLCSESFKVQMRALATGSDGLASIATEDILSIIVPRVPAAGLRATLQHRLDDAQRGHLLLPRMVREELARTAPALNIPPRSSHVVQV
jgi:type I restriction enzyme M protein